VQDRADWSHRVQNESTCHPKLVETGLDLLAFPTLYFYQTGYSPHTLRQASRRSWRIGQKHPVKVKFFVSKATTQTTCPVDREEDAGGGWPHGMCQIHADQINADLLAFLKE
jgi:hypothetical protein